MAETLRNFHATSGTSPATHTPHTYTPISGAVPGHKHKAWCRAWRDSQGDNRQETRPVHSHPRIIAYLNMRHAHTANSNDRVPQYAHPYRTRERCPGTRPRAQQRKRNGVCGICAMAIGRKQRQATPKTRYVHPCLWASRATGHHAPGSMSGAANSNSGPHQRWGLCNHGGHFHPHSSIFSGLT